MTKLKKSMFPEGKRCKYVRKEGESCTLNNKCKYPNCELVDIEKKRLTCNLLSKYFQNIDQTLHC